MSEKSTVAVYGAYGHTGRFVVNELHRRGFRTILSARGEGHGPAEESAGPRTEIRIASVETPGELDSAISGASAVINCAGPFIDTAVPLVEAAIRARIPYVDIAAEQPSVATVFDEFSRTAAEARVVVTPAMGFYGALGDVLATAAMRDWTSADDVSIAVALDSWHPTRGTRRTGERNAGTRLILTHGALERMDPPPGPPWTFPPPFGLQEVVGLALSETILISRHLRVAEVRGFLNRAPLRDLLDPATPAPVPSDKLGRSSQVFVMEVVVRNGSQQRRTVARGQDIYAVTAPIAVEAVERIVAGRASGVGVLAAGEAFDARDFLGALQSSYPGLEIRGVPFE